MDGVVPFLTALAVIAIVALAIGHFRRRHWPAQLARPAPGTVVKGTAWFRPFYFGLVLVLSFGLPWLQPHDLSSLCSRWAAHPELARWVFASWLWGGPALLLVLSVFGTRSALAAFRGGYWPSLDDLRWIDTPVKFGANARLRAGLRLLLFIAASAAVIAVASQFGLLSRSFASVQCPVERSELP